MVTQEEETTQKVVIDYTFNSPMGTLSCVAGPFSPQKAEECIVTLKKWYLDSLVSIAIRPFTPPA